MDVDVVLSIISIIVSLVLSTGSIVLSLWFYKESNKQNKETALIQTSINAAIQKLNDVYNKTYTDTFSVLKSQVDAMQKHIFPSVGKTNTGEPNMLRLSILGCITQNEEITLESICNQINGFDKAEIQQMIYSFHEEGIISFDGKTIKSIKTNSTQTPAGTT